MNLSSAPRVGNLKQAGAKTLTPKGKTSEIVEGKNVSSFDMFNCTVIVKGQSNEANY